MEMQESWFNNILLEIRPLLQSINVFIILKEKLQNIDIKLSKNIIKINFNKYFCDIDVKNVELVENSLTNLQINDDSISFRITTNNKNHNGTFKTEVLSINKKTQTENNQVLNKEDYTLYCPNCSQEFVHLTHFERILPLPSENCEPNDWFCHKQLNGNNIDLNPKPKDIFYSQCFVHIHSQLLNGIEINGNVLTCKDCSYWIGLNLSDYVHKIWYNSVFFKSENENIKSNPLKDTFDTLQSLQDNDLCTSNKIILTCQESHDNFNYLLLWVIEKSLTIQLYNKTSKRQTQAAKILYKFGSNESDELKSWKNDVSISTIAISKYMMNAIVLHINDMHKLIPNNFAKSNNFFISYLLMYDETFITN